MVVVAAAAAAAVVAAVAVAVAVAAAAQVAAVAAWAQLQAVVHRWAAWSRTEPPIRHCDVAQGSYPGGLGRTGEFRCL